MKAHLAYLRYVLRHKWHVFYGCMRLGVPLHQAIIHDWQKFTPIEWFPYVAMFYGGPHKTAAEIEALTVRRHAGYHEVSAEDVQSAFDRAWLHHQHYGPHHWQYWLLREDSGATKALPIPQRFVLEMVADWYGAGMAISGTRDLITWYTANKGKIVLEDDTCRRVEAVMELACQRGLVDAQPGEPDPFYTVK